MRIFAFDEVSMMNRKLVDYVDYRMQEVDVGANLPFAGKHVIFPGYFHQLL